MQYISPLLPVALGAFVRQVIQQGEPLRLINVNDKPIGAGLIRHSGIRFKAIDNDLVIVPA